jgi:biopolymer transport protein ExbD
MWTDLSRLQRRVRHRRLGSRRYALFSNLNPSVLSQSMLSCVVVLLLVEMVSHPQVHHSLPFDRYISRNAIAMPAALRDDAIKVMLARDGVIYFGGTKIASEDLPKQLRQRLSSNPQHKIFLVVDQRAKFGDVSIVLDDVRRAGAWDVAFLTELRAVR